MSPILIGIIFIFILFLLMASGMNVGIAMAVSAFFGLVYLLGFNQALAILGAAPYRTAAAYTMSVIPLFVLMGNLSFYAGVSEDLYDTNYKLFGHLPGGLAMATTVGCAGFAATCGSSVATAVTMGSISIPEMKKYKYAPTLAAGCLAAGGTLGILIPPSIGFIIYSMLTNESIGKLFVAGIFPGILLTFLFVLTIYVLVRRNPTLGPSGPRFSLKEKLASFKGIWSALSLFILVIGGLYVGIFTPSEAGGIGAFGAFLLMAFRKKLTRANLTNVLVDTGKVTAMCFIILVGANVFGYFMAVTRIPNALADLAVSLPLPPVLIVVFILIIYLILGSVMDSIAMIVLTVPIFYPVVMELGFDSIWFGVVMVLVMEMALITPPVGMNVFAIAGVAPDIDLYTVFKGVFPFLVAMFVCIAILFVIPQIATFLPGLM
ncbi:MAG: TRAP transporter large permease [Desulfobacterales bacterium]|nr:TRAP transporter large permease [Desulfobacterales bacterium]MDX2511075.1 TRAP transporter large permease [Desulfobacterales bacterium]